MNMRVQRTVGAVPAGRADCALRVVRERPATQAMAIPLTAGVAALAFDTEAGASRRGRLDGMVGGQGLPRPALSSCLPLRRGGARHVLLLAHSAERLAATPCLITLDGEPVATIDPDWLQSALAEPAALVDDLTSEGRQRLLRMLLTTGASLFAGGDAKGFRAAMRRLIRLLAVEEIAISAICALGASERLSSCRVPAGGDAPEFDALIAMTDDAVIRVTGFSMQLERLAKGDWLLHVHAPGAPAKATLVGIGRRPLLLMPPDTATPRPIASWLTLRTTPVQTWAEGLLANLAGTDAAAAAALAEVHQGDAPPPALAVRHLSATRGGTLALLAVDDPHRLVDAVRLDIDGAELDLPVRPAGTQRVAGGFIATPGPLRAGTRCRLRLIYASGRLRDAGATTIAAFDSRVPDGFGELGPTQARAALAAARLDAVWRGLDPTIETIGRTPARPCLSLVARAGADPDLIRARAAVLLQEPRAEKVEIVYYAGEQEAEAVRRLLSEIHVVLGQPARLLVFPDGTDAAAGLRAALDAAKGPAALSLGADVLPSAGGWLATWTRALAMAKGATLLGALLLAPDGSILDAGGELQVARNNAPGKFVRRWRGLPAGFVPGAPTVPTMLLSADAVGLNARALAALRRWDAHYPDPDVLLSGFASRLRQKAVATLLAGPMMRFGAEAPADPLTTAVDAEALTILRQRPRRAAGAAR